MTKDKGKDESENLDPEDELRFVTYGGISHLKRLGWRGSLCGDYIRPEDLDKNQSKETLHPVCGKCHKSWERIQSD